MSADMRALGESIRAARMRKGLTQEALALCADRITIPMGGRAESLNAAAASTILLWEMARKGGRGHD